MKKKFFAAAMALCLMAGTSAFAQDAKSTPMPDKQAPAEKQWTPEQIAQKKADKLAMELKLNAQQKQQVYDYTLWQVKDMWAKRDQMQAMDPQAKREAMMKRNQAEKDKMKSILTPEQYMQWEKMQMEKAKGKMDGKKDGKGCWKDKDGKQKCDKPADGMKK